MTRYRPRPIPTPPTSAMFTLALLIAGALPAAAQDTVVAMGTGSVDKGDVTWMLVSTILVVTMILPGLALFYGGLVRARNMLSVLMQVFTIFCVITLLWVIYGYSLAFTGPEAGGGVASFIGGLDKAFLRGVTLDSTVATFSDGVRLPELSFVAFQLTFACIAPALIVGGVVERMKFSAVLVFAVLWFTFAYLPMAHLVWYSGGALFRLGALDFAGGTVVHINSGVAALVAAIMVGPRLGFGRDQMLPHNLTFTMIGGCLLWVGWFGFNAGSNLEANALTVQALLATLVAPAAAALAWTLAEWAYRGHPSMLGAVSGAVAGLVAITPAAGTVGTMGALVIGLAAGLICLWAVVGLKRTLGYDDSLDVFGIHGVGGIVGAVLTGVFAAPGLGGFAGEAFSIGAQVAKQLIGVGVAVLWSGAVSAVILVGLRAILGLRVTENDEREGLDLTTHGERAYSN
ncbi:ammonium transporter [Paracoccus suum]|uniref:Ammonium transporter n=1 Tax=Paracoccus suum TaxID=2259340 RepID=A0A344PHE5_9RHOB|nr:ammonium transporter [Paracoccus suum]AXC48800.1 ammonium transporter [Paracoccus suum]